MAAASKAAPGTEPRAAADHTPDTGAGDDRDTLVDLLTEVRELTPKLKALADDHRLQIMLLLAGRPHTVRELTDATGLSQTLVSHHLAPLREQGLVTVTPKGRSNIYALCCEELGGPVRLLSCLSTADRCGPR